MGVIVPGPSSIKLALDIAKQSNMRAINVQHKLFPDGESYIRYIDDVKDEDVYIVQSLSPPQDRRIFQLLLLADTARRLEARTITAIIPYLAYARQDRCFLKGEAVSLHTLLRILACIGVSRLITVDTHSPEALASADIEAINLSAISLLAEYFKKKGVEKALSLAPGKKAENMAKEADKILKGGYGVVSSKRDKMTGQVEVESKVDVEGKDVVIFDDIISTGGTMMKTVKLVKNRGARRVFVACVHPLLIGDSKNKILSAGALEIIGTNTVDSDVSVVSIAPLIASVIR